MAYEYFVYILPYNGLEEKNGRFGKTSKDMRLGAANYRYLYLLETTPDISENIILLLCRA